MSLRKLCCFLSVLLVVSIFSLSAISCSSNPSNAPPGINIQTQSPRTTLGQPYMFSVHALASDTATLHITVVGESSNQTLLDTEQPLNIGESKPTFTVTALTDGTYTIQAEMMTGSNSYSDAARFGVVVAEGGPSDLLTYQLITGDDLATRTCQSTEESLIDVPIPAGANLTLHLFPDVTQMNVAGFRSFYGEVKNDQTRPVFVTCADNKLFLKITDQDDPIYIESTKGVNASPADYIYYRQSWLDGKFLQNSIRSGSHVGAKNQNVIYEALNKPQCRAIKIAAYLGFGVSESEAKAAWIGAMDILQKYLTFNFTIQRFEPITLDPSSTSLDQIGDDFCWMKTPALDKTDVTGFHLFTNPGPNDSDPGCRNKIGVEYPNEIPLCGATLMKRSSILCGASDWISGFTKALITAHEIGHSFGMEHDCDITKQGFPYPPKCTLMFSKAPDQNGLVCDGYCDKQTEVLSDKSIQQAIKADYCDATSMPKTCPQHCVLPLGTCINGSGICLCATGFAGIECDRCELGFVGYPNCHLWGAASCFDGIKNGTETDVDCGGNCTKCPNGQTCTSNPHCQGGLCSAGICQATPSAWRFMASGVTEDLLDVWGSAASDVWAVGFSGRVLHWDGRKWSSVPSGNTANLYGLWGASKNDIWTGGAGGVILHRNGGSFAQESVPVGAPGIFGLFGTGINDVWAVGTGGGNTILHRTGGSWTNSYMGYPVISQKGWASGTADAWSVGYNEMTTTPALLRWNGTSWATFSLPGGAASALRSIWGAASNDVWVGDDQGGLMHFDGTSWTWKNGGTTSPIFGIWGSASNNIWAVGGGGGGQGACVALHGNPLGRGECGGRDVLAARNLGQWEGRHLGRRFRWNDSALFPLTAIARFLY